VLIIICSLIFETILTHIVTIIIIIIGVQCLDSDYQRLSYAV